MCRYKGMCFPCNGFPVRFGGLGCRRVGDISLPSSMASMKSVVGLIETILSRINIADTNELAEAVDSWRGASGGDSLPDDPRRQKAWHLPIVKKKWDNRCCWRRIRCLEPD